jgi:uncharacterized protein (TIGR04255 family)
MSASSKSGDPSGDTLPSFRNPPLIEMVLGIQFADLQSFTSAHAGLFWSEVRQDFPKMSEQGPLLPTFEMFGGFPQPQPLIQFQQVFSAPVNRYWLESSTGDFLLQLQPNKLILNWRRMDEPGGSYPRYENVRKRFEREITRLQSFLQRESLGDLVPNQAEVNYVNIIPSDQAKRLEEITPLWEGAPTVPNTELENASFQTRHILSDRDGPFARLYTQVARVIRASDSDLSYRFEVSARGKPKEETVQSALALLDVERAAIVQTFDAFTSETMHKMWRREDG